MIERGTTGWPRHPGKIEHSAHDPVPTDRRVAKRRVRPLMLDGLVGNRVLSDKKEARGDSRAIALATELAMQEVHENSTQSYAISANYFRASLPMFRRRRTGGSRGISPLGARPVQRGFRECR
jgi:hypothetical protein